VARGVADLEVLVLEAAVEDVDVVERRLVRDPGELRLEGRRLRVDRRTRVRVVRVVRGLHGQVTHALQDRVRLGQGALSGLHDRDAVLGVADGDLEATDLRAQTLRDRQTGSVVGRTV